MAESVVVTLPKTLPVWLGVNVTPKLHEVCAVSVAVQLLLAIAKSPLAAILSLFKVVA